MIDRSLGRVYQMISLIVLRDKDHSLRSEPEVEAVAESALSAFCDG